MRSHVTKTFISDATMKQYVSLCQRGGGAPFQQLVRSAGLKSPFEKGCLEEVVNSLYKHLEVDPILGAR